MMKLMLIILIVLQVVLLRFLSKIHFLFIRTGKKGFKKVLIIYREEFSFRERLFLIDFIKTDGYKIFFIMNYILSFVAIFTIVMFVFDISLWVKSFVALAILSTLFDSFVMCDAYFE